MTVNLEFEQNPDGRYHMSKSTTLADFSLTKSKKGGLFGIRTIVYSNYILNKPHPDSTYQNQEAAVSDEVKYRSDKFWVANRLDTLSTAESKVYKNVDSLRNMPSLQTYFGYCHVTVKSSYKGFGSWELAQT